MSKITSKNWWLLFALILSGCMPAERRRLNRMWPGNNTLGHRVVNRIFHAGFYTIPITAGYILTKNNDTLKGYIKLAIDHPLDNIPLLPFDKSKKTDINEVKLSNIDFVRMKLPSKTDSIDYMPLPIKPPKGKGVRPMPIKYYMWQILGRKNQMRLCYHEWGVGDSDGNSTYYGELVLVLEKENRDIHLIPLLGLDPPSRFLLQFINKRYEQHFKKEDFNDEKNKIDYILDKENEKQLSK